ncbi:flagellar biosynthesis protein FlhF [Helicobacter sp. 10-6591]|uniref:flagellar biosynthesis protein FlhF n=1 Tax=Helicobacter sp. 10-6591 TaxID=2004998 RepID=UPI000DCE2A45|nr:flagellar biosynthesis protein FlhF [Helicobacter sp. 10-6591]RAX55566.1 flagellar biosynthesis protein FlhF [Helicobacter sp. 10-6591]
MARKLHTFAGETAAHAMQKAVQAYGDDVLIVETKEIRKKSLNQPGLYELVVAVEEADTSNIDIQKDEQTTTNIQQKIDEIALKELARKKTQRDNDVSLQISDAAQIKNMVGEVANIVQNDLHIIPPPKSQARVAPQKVALASNPYMQTGIDSKGLDSKIEDMQRVRMKESHAERAEFKEIRQELDKINDKMKIIQNMFWEEKAPEGLIIPQEFAEIYRLAKASGMNKEHLDSIMRLSLELMPLRMRENSVTIKRYFREVLRKMIFCRSENLPLGHKKIMMLVGPTGVGKTTTLAKLAARYSIMLEKRHKVGIITLDTYRLAAVDQLMAYARMMRLSIDTVVEPDEFGKAIDSLRHCDVILIDTAGHSQHDRQKLEALKNYVNNDYKIDVSLVLALNAKYEDLRDTYNAFDGCLEIDTIIFSKLDESRNFGNMFSLVYETKKPISYLSTGQSVPNDLILATNDYLVDCLLDGFKKSKEQ